jgi:hypothetical protein
MKALETPEELREAEAAAMGVFKSIGLRTTEPFNEKIETRILIYPIVYTMLGREHFGAVADAAAAVGDAVAYLAPYGDLEAGWRGTYDHRLVQLDDFSEYKPSDALILEHLLYSPKGAWGVMTSHGDFALAGGSPTFVETLRGHLPEQEATARAFVRDWKDLGRGGGNIEWLRPLLVHLYGEVKADNLWDHSNGSGAPSG